MVKQFSVEHGSIKNLEIESSAHKSKYSGVLWNSWLVVLAPDVFGWVGFFVKHLLAKN